MLRKPRPLPRRFNRTVTPATRTLARRHMKQRRPYVRQRLQRSVQRWQRKTVALKQAARRVLLIAIPVCILLGIGFFIFSPVLRIREIRVIRSDPRIDAEQVQRGLAPLFGSHLFFLSTQEVLGLLTKAVPDMETVQVAKQYPSSLELRLTLDPIIAKLTIDDPDRRTTSGSGANAAGAPLPPTSDYLTSEGMYVVYNDTQVRTGSGIFALHVVDWGVRPAPWKPLIEPSILAVIAQAETALTQRFGYGVQSRTIFLRAREFHLKTNTHTLWFDLRNPLEDQIDRYRLFLQTVGSSAAREYVDLRLADKVVYK